ncbi:hypothetical protein I3842_15G093900 [Carya illinoinensis]|uniref:non-specific serine/threonine protein kinase n=1 Tax=Carya illinoinensis TaxID=32201 RepID=A0A922AAD7_CARIL|nr:hypothetical protein I3842_15G093900 [Carya illinoinensis]
MKLQLLFLAFFLSGIHFIYSFTDPHDATVLLTLKDAWKNTPPSWEHSLDPCGLPGWEGVTCNNSTYRVTALKLSTMGLEGKLEGDIGELTELTTLDLSFNRGLKGSLSPQLGKLQNLTFLILAGCSFNGDIPYELGNLSNLVFLALNTNNLTGKIPPSLGSFSKLLWLDLAENMLTGSLPISTSKTPGLDLLSEARHFHFNKNKLSGPIPAKLFSSNMNLRHMDLSNNSFKPSEAPTWFSSLSTLTTLVMENGSLQGSIPHELFSFPQLEEVLRGNPVCNDHTSSLDAYCQENQQTPKPYYPSLANCECTSCLLDQDCNPWNCECVYPYKGTLSVGGSLLSELPNATVLKLLENSLSMSQSLLPGSIYIQASWKSSGNDSSGEAPQLKDARRFSYVELRKCTNNFAERNVIGSGAYGKVYRGLLSNGQVVAIKRAQQGSMQSLLEFKTEIELLSRVHHKNLVGLVGFCFEQGKQILIYEFMPNGTIRDSLSGKSGIYLDWNRRLYIALGSATGLAYLHEHANPPIIHRDVKSTNILLDENLTAKVADFGLSKLVSDALTSNVSTQVKGTMGYLDPEYYQTQQLTEKSDVYSFGVFMLELLTSKRPIVKGKYIVHRVRTTMNKDEEVHYGLWDMIDLSIRDTKNLIGFGKFLEITMQCIEDSPEDRPTMSEVVKALETILQNDGVVSSTSTLSPTSDLGASRGAFNHPYNDPKHKMDVISIDTFGYSGAYTISTRV